MIKQKIFVLFISLFVIISSAHSFEGPLQIKNQFPLFLYLNAPYLEKASTENSFSLSLTHSSVFLIKDSSNWSINLDMEITELNLRYRKNINDFAEIGVEVPFFSFNSGFMDGFLDAYHSAFGFPDYGRSEMPKNKFLYEIKRDDVTLVKAEGGRFGIGDIRVTIKKQILRDDPAISIMADLELPTGNAKKAYGNGNIDGGIAILLDKRLSEKVKSYFNIGAVFPGDLKAYETISLKNFIYGGAGIEYLAFNNIGIIGQLIIQGTPFPKTEISSVDRTSVLLSVGGRYSSGNNSLEFSITEDPNTSGAPDFSLNLLLKWRF